MAAAQLTGLSASVTRILSLSGFPSELKTRDIQAAFSDWENINGGFKIKWRDDTSLLIVFADANTAKRAYLQALAQPPPVLGSPTSSKTALIRPYDGPDAQHVIATVNARTHGHNPRHGHHSRASISGGVAGMMGVGVPASNGRKGHNGNGNGNASIASMGGTAAAPALNVNGLASSTAPVAAPAAFSIGTAVEPLTFPRDHSPTLPNVPAHPTLSSLINLSLSPNGEGTEGSEDIFVSEESASLAGAPAVNTTPAAPTATVTGSSSTPPRIGDPGRRMVGHALGIKHPSLGGSSTTSEKAGVTGSGAASRSESPSTNVGVSGVQRAMAGLNVSEA